MKSSFVLELRASASRWNRVFEGVFVGAMALFCLLALTGCKTTSGSGAVAGYEAQGSLSESETEQKILREAKTAGYIVGGVVGAGAGAVIGHQLQGRVPGMSAVTGGLIGGALGSLGGGAVGQRVGEGQVANVRDKRSQNAKLAELVASAREYNREVARHNAELRKRITNMRGLTADDRAYVAKVEQRAAEKSLKAVDEVIQKRRSEGGGVPDYSKTVAELERERAALERSIEVLKQLQ
jgi:hypothetical protein